MGSVVKGITGAVGGVAKTVFGSGSSSPGFAGTGKFREGGKYDPAKDSFEVKNLEAKKETVAREAQKAEGREQFAGEKRQKLIERLEARAKGEAPSLAEAQLKAASDRNLAQQLAAAQSQRGGNQASLQRNLMRSQAEAGRELGAQSAQARLAEQAQVETQLAQELGDEVALASDLRGKYLGLGFSLDAADAKAKQELEALRAGTQLSQSALNLQAFEGAAGRRSQMFGQAASGLGAAMLSDKRQKQKIKKIKNKEMVKELHTLSSETEKKNKIKISTFGSNDSEEESSSLDTFGKALSLSKGADKVKKQREASSEKKSSGPDPKMLAALAVASDKNTKQNKKDFNPKDFLNKLKAYSYEYKNPNMPGAGDGRYVSVMAQDLEKAGPVGQSMVKETEEGTKMVDYGKGFGAILAAQAHLNERLSELEKKKKKKKA